MALTAKVLFARAGARTLDRQVKSLTLYRLSYPGSLNLTWNSFPRFQQKKKNLNCLQSGLTNVYRWGRSSDGRALAQHVRGRGIDTPRLQKFFLLLFMYLSFFFSLSIPLVCFRFGNEWTQLVLYERRRDKRFASSGNRTRAARVAGEHSTTEQ